MIFDFFKRDKININVGDHFAAESKSKNDRSWASSTFICIERDDKRLVGKIVSKESNMFSDAVVTFSKKDWDFNLVSENFLRAQLSGNRTIM
ncbi:MAG: hypothetical protein WC107_04790 [Patescibacteria group bacterium]